MAYQSLNDKQINPRTGLPYVFGPPPGANNPNVDPFTHLPYVNGLDDRDRPPPVPGGTVAPNSNTPVTPLPQSATVPMAGSPYAGEGALADPTVSFSADFLYGRDPNYASNHATNAENVAGGYAQDFMNLGNMSIAQGQQGQQALLNTAHDAGANQQALGMQAVNRGTTQTNRADTFTGQAVGVANDLAGMGGQSAAQAQLQSGLNQSQAANLALARSGRGFGGSSAAMGQAIDANAAAGQSAANNSALLRMQAQQAAAGIYGGAAQQNMNAALANSQAGMNMYGQGYNTQLQGQQAGYGMGLQANQLAGQLHGQGASEFFAGQQTAKAFTDAQHGADVQREQQGMQQWGIENGVAIQNAQMQQQQLGAEIGGAATTAAALAPLVFSDVRGKTNIQPADGQVPAGMQGEDLEAAVTRPRMQPPRPVSADRIAAIHAKLDALLGKKAAASPAVVAVPARAVPVQPQAVSPVDENFSGYYRVPAGFDPEADRAAVQQISFPDDVVPSDEELKGGKGGASDEIADTFGNLHGYSYDYRDPARDGHGRQYGIMAQDLAQTPAGASVVQPDERGMLTVNAPKLSMMNAAATGAHERRIAELEAQLDALLGKSKGGGAASAPKTGTADTAALDAAARRQGTPVNAPRGAVAAAPTARFADYSPPTARFADVPSSYSYDYSQPIAGKPVAASSHFERLPAQAERAAFVQAAQDHDKSRALSSGAAPKIYGSFGMQPEELPEMIVPGSGVPTVPQPWHGWGGIDIAALDEAQRRQGGPVREETY